MSWFTAVDLAYLVTMNSVPRTSARNRRFCAVLTRVAARTLVTPAPG